MAYDREYIYVTWGGHLGSGGQEIWQNGVKLASPNAGDTPAFPTLTNGQALMTAMQTSWALTSNNCASYCYLQWVKFSRISKDGKLKGEPLYVSSTPTTGIAGPQSTTAHPYQVAMVATLWSGESYGKANYGRIYLPAPAYPVGNDGLIVGSNLNHANWVGTWLKGIENSAATWPGGTAPLYIHIMHNNFTEDGGYSRRPTKLRLGNVLDTQRRRRNALHETYTTATSYP